MPTGPVLRVEADLRFSVGDAGREATGTVAAGGDTVTVTVDRPWTALRALRSADLPGGARGRSDLAPVAAAVAAAGLRIVITGPHGTLITIGDGVASELGRLATGSSEIALRPRAILGVRRTGLVLGLIGTATVALSVIGLRRRPGGGGRRRSS